MGVLDTYKSKEKITIKRIVVRYSQKAKLDYDISKKEITERTVFNFLKKYSVYKYQIDAHNTKINTEIYVQ